MAFGILVGGLFGPPLPPWRPPLTSRAAQRSRGRPPPSTAHSLAFHAALFDGTVWPDPEDAMAFGILVGGLFGPPLPPWRPPLT